MTAAQARTEHGSELTQTGGSSTEAQGSDYDFKQHKFEYGNGLDCSGYVGWAVYNYFGGGKTGYVTHAKNQGRMFAEMGFGEYHPKMIELMPGDIVSSIDHVYITVARCADGSIILLHSSPPGVQLCGTVTPRGGRVGIADSLVKEYTKRFYPDWYRKFSYCSRGAAYLRDCGVFRWHDAVMPDPCGLKKHASRKNFKNFIHMKKSGAKLRRSYYINLSE